MPALEPAYRGTLYAPRSTDATKATVLTPVAGSVHSNEFKVASINGVAGFQPYLDASPRGRRSQIDPLAKRLDTGEQVWRIMDKRTGTSNLERWLTAFIGDSGGGNQLLGLKWYAEQSLDGGSTWAAFFTGRVAGVATDGKIMMELRVREFADDLDNDIFFGPPATEVSAYAHHAQVAPIGLLHAYGDFPLVEKIRGTVGAVVATGEQEFRIDVDRSNGDPYRTIFTQALRDLVRHGAGTDAAFSYGRGKVWISVVGSGTWAAYDFAFYWRLFQNTSLDSFFARPLPGGAAQPALSASIDFYIESLVAGVSEQLPLLINDVHPVTLLRDLCAGYFGRLDDAGDPTWSVAVNDASFDALEADETIPDVRFVITKREQLREWAEKNLLKPNHLALRLNESGELVIVDFRRSSTVSAAWTLTDEDLVTTRDAVSFEQDKDGAIASVTAKYYGERLVENEDLPTPFTRRQNGDAFPSIATVRIQELTDFLVKVTSFSDRSLDVGGKEFEIDAKGLRFRVAGERTAEERIGGPVSPRTLSYRSTLLTAYLARLASDIRSPFGLGPTYYTIVARRASANVALVHVGTTGVLNIDAIPDPATRVRGGSRVAICLSRIGGRKASPDPHSRRGGATNSRCACGRGAVRRVWPPGRGVSARQCCLLRDGGRLRRRRSTRLSGTQQPRRYRLDSRRARR